MAKPSKRKALDALNKLNNYSKLPADHRWVSTVRHYIKDKKGSPHNADSPKCLCIRCSKPVDGPSYVLDGNLWCLDCSRFYKGSWDK